MAILRYCKLSGPGPRLSATEILMDVKQQIEEKLRGSMVVEHLQVVDESHMHNVPLGAQSHWRITVVSNDFGGMRAVQRHRKLYTALREEMASHIHALAVEAWTPEEYQKAQHTPGQSPQCMGGSKGEH